jgi:hypothetical protein
VLAWREADGLLSEAHSSAANVLLEDIVVRQEFWSKPLAPLVERYPQALRPGLGVSRDTSSVSLAREILLSRPLLALCLLAYPAWTVLLGCGVRSPRRPE